MSLLTDPYHSRQQSHAEIRKRQDPVLHGDWQSRINQPLNQILLKQFERDGFLFFEKFLKEKEVKTLLHELARLKNDEKRDQKPQYITEPTSGEVRSIFQVHASSAIFKSLAEDERIAGIAQQILGSEVYMHQSRINLKPAFEGKEFYWHSDFETWHVEDGMPGMRALSCSVTLTDNYPFNGPLMLIPGSHQHYLVCVGETPRDHYKKSLKKQEYGIPDHQSLEWLTHQGGIVQPAGPAGSVIFFDCNMMHGSNSNITPYPRTNVFFVYNSVHNRLCAPFGAPKPRPEFIATRETFEPISYIDSTCLS